MMNFRECTSELVYRTTKLNKCSKVFSLDEYKGEITKLTNQLKIENDRGFSRASDVSFWLKTREENRWNKSPITGLKRTSKEHLFYGDIRSRKGRTLVVFEFFDEGNSLRVYQFKEGFYSLKVLNPYL